MKRGGFSIGLAKGEKKKKTTDGTEKAQRFRFHTQETPTIQVPGFHIGRNKITIFSIENIALWELYYISYCSEFKYRIVIFSE